MCEPERRAARAFLPNEANLRRADGTFGFCGRFSAYSDDMGRGRVKEGWPGFGIPMLARDGFEGQGGLFRDRHRGCISVDYSNQRDIEPETTRTCPHRRAY